MRFFSGERLDSAVGVCQAGHDAGCAVDAPDHGFPAGKLVGKGFDGDMAV
ncbi:MAG: hypothetical protein JEZ02_16265 [Desulfatibacillum sp.]|nr:hypothetical protein [Desulfatibacillum sp.]